MRLRSRRRPPIKSPRERASREAARARLTSQVLAASSRMQMRQTRRRRRARRPRRREQEHARIRRERRASFPRRPPRRTQVRARSSRAVSTIHGRRTAPYLVGVWTSLQPSRRLAVESATARQAVILARRATAHPAMAIDRHYPTVTMACRFLRRLTRLTLAIQSRSAS